LDFCIVKGGDKRITAKRYVHGIIQIQVRGQVASPQVGRLANDLGEMTNDLLRPELKKQCPLGRRFCRVDCKFRPGIQGPIHSKCSWDYNLLFYDRAERGAVFLFLDLPFALVSAISSSEAHNFFTHVCVNC